LLTVEVARLEPDVYVLHLAGRITLGRDSQQIEWTIDDLQRADAKKVVFDMSNVTFIDSTGIGILVMCAGKLKEIGGALRVAGATGVVEQTMKLCKLGIIVPMDSSVATSASAFTAAAAAQ
jgi:anti-sigma B factor antagonist